MESKKQKEQQREGQRPRLERLNAVKNIDYKEVVTMARGASWSASSVPNSIDVLSLRTARSLDVFPSWYPKQTSFRIDGSSDEEIEVLCRYLGLSGPDDFAISVEEWETTKARSLSDIFPRCRLLHCNSSRVLEPAVVPTEELQESQQDNGEGAQQIFSCSRGEFQFVDNRDLSCGFPSQSNGGIRDVQLPVLASQKLNISLSPKISNSSVINAPAMLKPPPYMGRQTSFRPVSSSSWDIIWSFGPNDERPDFGVERSESVANSKDVTVLPEVLQKEEGSVGGASEDSSSNNDETSTGAGKILFTVSSRGRLKRRITSWTLGQLLGSGSYGRVFEAISEEGVFFAVKEVSLLDQGSNTQPCINQLEQEISLLSQFEHENIVQYYGTDKEEGKLLIFLELVSQGSIVALYQKYVLRDSQVSSYTRQILNGLNYLHERNVVHRDIKCANILVHANGSVKLADFGLAKEMTKISMLRSCKGSVYWMAPEVINPRRTYGPPADIWSLGCTVLEMLTRDVPFPNLEWTVAFYMIGQGRQPLIPDSLSSVARDFIGQCVKVNPDDRPSAAELLQHPFIRSSSSKSKFCSEGNGRWW